jgi:hypothetical protein
MLANQGLALGLSGNDDEANKYLDAAAFYAHGRPHETAVGLFNRALLHFRHARPAEGQDHLTRAFGLSSEIRRYCDFSV